jgi:hypothetical protein
VCLARPIVSSLELSRMYSICCKTPQNQQKEKGKTQKEKGEENQQ